LLHPAALRPEAASLPCPAPAPAWKFGGSGSILATSDTQIVTDIAILARWFLSSQVWALNLPPANCGLPGLIFILDSFDDYDFSKEIHSQKNVDFVLYEFSLC
jgi:hypothetical protein